MLLSFKGLVIIFCQKPSFMKKMHLLFPVFALLLLIMSCSKSSSDTPAPGITCDGTVRSFATDVNPIIQTYCNQAGCHTNGSSNGPGPLTNYTQVFNARSAISGAVASGLMPQNATLSTAQKKAIVCWIDSGAPNN
jgi:hypothetical protein